MVSLRGSRKRFAAVFVQKDVFGFSQILTEVPSDSPIRPVPSFSAKNRSLKHNKKLKQQNLCSRFSTSSVGHSDLVKEFCSFLLSGKKPIFFLLSELSQRAEENGITLLDLVITRENIQVLALTRLASLYSVFLSFARVQNVSIKFDELKGNPFYLFVRLLSDFFNDPPKIEKTRKVEIASFSEHVFYFFREVFKLEIVFTLLEESSFVSVLVLSRTAINVYEKTTFSKMFLADCFALSFLGRKFQSKLGSSLSAELELLANPVAVRHLFWLLEDFDTLDLDFTSSAVDFLQWLFAEDYKTALCFDIVVLCSFETIVYKLFKAKEKIAQQLSDTSSTRNPNNLRMATDTLKKLSDFSEYVLAKLEECLLRDETVSARLLFLGNRFNETELRRIWEGEKEEKFISQEHFQSNIKDSVEELSKTEIDFLKSFYEQFKTQPQCYELMAVEFNSIFEKVLSPVFIERLINNLRNTKD